MKGFRTVAFNILMTIVSVVTLTNPTETVPDPSAINAALDSVESLIPFVWGLGNIILRAVTNSPIFKTGAAE